MSTLFPNLPKPKRRPRLTSQLRALLGHEWRVKREGNRIHLDYRQGQHCPCVVVGVWTWLVFDGHGDEREAIPSDYGIAELVACLRSVVGEPAAG